MTGPARDAAIEDALCALLIESAKLIEALVKREVAAAEAAADQLEEISRDLDVTLGNGAS